MLCIMPCAVGGCVRSCVVLCVDIHLQQHAAAAAAAAVTHTTQRNILPSFFLSVLPQVLNGPDTTLWVIEDVGATPELKAMEHPRRIYFAREVAKGRRDLVNTMDLKKRIYLGTRYVPIDQKWAALH